MPKNSIDIDSITIFVQAKVYSKDAVLKCLYWYGDKFQTTIELTAEDFFKITIKPVVNDQLDLGQLMFKVERDLLDFQLRDIVTKETANIRDLLIAKAFSNGEFDETPPGTASDPVGIDFTKPRT